MCLHTTKSTSCSLVISALPTSGEWRRPTCAVVSISYTSHMDLPSFRLRALYDDSFLFQIAKWFAIRSAFVKSP